MPNPNMIYDLPAGFYGFVLPQKECFKYHRERELQRNRCGDKERKS